MKASFKNTSSTFYTQIALLYRVSSLTGKIQRLQDRYFHIGLAEKDRPHLGMAELERLRKQNEMDLKINKDLMVDPEGRKRRWEERRKAILARKKMFLKRQAAQIKKNEENREWPVNKMEAKQREAKKKKMFLKRRAAQIKKTDDADRELREKQKEAFVTSD